MQGLKCIDKLFVFIPGCADRVAEDEKVPRLTEINKLYYDLLGDLCIYRRPRVIIDEWTA